MSGLVTRLVDEGLRMEEHPGVVFRDGPAGRRAGLVGGPDVWEVIIVLRDATPRRRSHAIRATAEWLALSEAQVRTAEGYYAAYPSEIEAFIEANAAAAAKAAIQEGVRERLYRD